MAKLLNLELTNFGSYNQFELQFNSSGLVLFTGNNGEGKSTIFDSICWCLFGYTLKGESGDDVINDTVGKNCIVHVTMEHPEGVVVVSRYRKHKIEKNNLHFDLLINGEEQSLDGFDNETTQKKIELFLEMNMTTFISSVIFAQGYSKFFASLGDTEQKGLMEGFIHAEIYSKAATLVDLDLKLTQGNIRAKEKEKSLSEAKYGSFKQEIEEYQKESDYFEVNREERLQISVKELATLDHEIEELLEKIKTTSKEGIERLTSTEGLEDKREEECSLCKQVIPSPNRKILLENKMAYDSLMIQVSQYSSDIKYLRQRRESLDRIYKEVKASVNTYWKLLEGLEGKAILNQEEIDEIDNEVMILRKQEAIQIQWKEEFSPRGVRAYLLDSVLPDLNMYISEYIQEVTEGAISVVINPDRVLKSGEVRNKFSLTITVHGKNRTYKSLSAGQKRIVNLSFLFSIHDMAVDKLKSPFNILVLDESLDTLDEIYTDAVFNVLTKKAEKVMIFVITHEEKFKKLFDTVYKVEQLNGFSTLTELDMYL